MTPHEILLICFLIGATEANFSRCDDPNSSDRQGKSLISLGSGDKTDIVVKFTLPVLTIPMDKKDTMRSGLGALAVPMVKVNVRNILIFTLLALFSSFVYPIIETRFGPQAATFSPPPDEYYSTPPPHWQESKTEWHGNKGNKSSRGFTFDILNWKDSLNGILFRDNSVTPCVQRIVCSAVVESKKTNKPTNVNKIVDVMASTMLFEQAANGTIVQDAVARGREYSETEECTKFYKECNVEPEIITNMLKLIGI